GAGFGYGGSQIPLLICLLPLGGASVALARSALLPHPPASSPIKGEGEQGRPPTATLPLSRGWETREAQRAGWPRGEGRAWLPLVGLVATVAVGPLLFLDPDEFFLGLGELEVGLVFRTAFLSLLIAFALGLILWALSARFAGSPRRTLAWGAFAASWGG